MKQTKVRRSRGALERADQRIEKGSVRRDKDAR
nr:MAG TPA: hypothetical protein [Caudoviricetes sp.]